MFRRGCGCHPFQCPITPSYTTSERLGAPSRTGLTLEPPPTMFAEVSYEVGMGVGASCVHTPLGETRTHPNNM